MKNLFDLITQAKNYYEPARPASIDTGYPKTVLVTREGCTFIGDLSKVDINEGEVIIKCWTIKGKTFTSAF